MKVDAEDKMRKNSKDEFLFSESTKVHIDLEGGVTNDQPRTSVARTISYLPVCLPEPNFHYLRILHCFFHLSLGQ